MDDYQKGLLDVLNRLAAIGEEAVRRLGTGTKRSGATIAGKKNKEALTVRGVLTAFEGPNDWKFYHCKIDGKKYSTRSSDIADILDRAWQGDAIVELSFTEKKAKKLDRDGNPFENRFIESVEIVTSSIVTDRSERPKPQLPPDEEKIRDEAPW
jgi:hypothetical protein